MAVRSVRSVRLSLSAANSEHWQPFLTDTSARGLAMMLLSKTFRASWSIGLAAALVAAVPPGRVARAENIGGAFAPPMLELSASEGAFRHLRALQDIASESGGNRPAGTL